MAYKKYQHYITIDPYMDVNRYNECVTALVNNAVPFEEFLYTKPPYSWYINVDTLPIMVNYEIADASKERFMVSKIKPLMPNEKYLLKRRETDGSGAPSLEKFVYNDVFNATDKYALFFRYKSKNELFEITRKLNCKIYLLGTYKDRTVALTYNKYVKAEIQSEFILLEKQEKELNSIGEFEVQMNYVGLGNKDKITKYTQTPYIMNGRYYPTKVNL